MVVFDVDQVEEFEMGDEVAESAGAEWVERGVLTLFPIPFVHGSRGDRTVGGPVRDDVVQQPMVRSE